MDEYIYDRYDTYPYMHSFDFIGTYHEAINKLQRLIDMWVPEDETNVPDISEDELMCLLDN